MSQQQPQKESLLTFLQDQGRAYRESDRRVTTLDRWEARRGVLREQLTESWGGFPDSKCPLDPQRVGVLDRDGYRVEKLLLQTRPGIHMTANAYVPEGDGPFPAVLSVHGHWRLAKQEPRVQARCIGLAKLGFFVLMVDAMGAGERGIQKALGEYHGEMVASTLWPTGLALAGLQVYENMRAIDYIQSRPEVDPDRIGVTGCSGGGNQTMYIGAMDDRLKAVVPVCSVGTYQAYLGAACCMCEVTPSALSYTEESGVLALVAPRALMVINATRDAFQFSVGEAKKSIAAARRVFRLYDRDAALRHAVFESGHDYNKEMRQTMYGWMTQHLKGEGNGSPIAEPAMTTEEPETLRCFPGESRPDNFVTLPQFAAAEAKRLLAAREQPDHRQEWQTERMQMLGMLRKRLGRFPQKTETDFQLSEGGGLRFNPEPGISVSGQFNTIQRDDQQIAILLDLDRGRKAVDDPLASTLADAEWSVLGLDLRGTGAAAQKGDAIGRAPDHNTGEWGLWVGRPLIGQWVWDLQRLLDVLTTNGRRRVNIAVVGFGPASLVALALAAMDRRPRHIVTIGGLASLVSDVPYEKQRLGTLVPGVLRDVGDVDHLASLTAPRRLVIAGAVDASGKSLDLANIRSTFKWTRQAFEFERVRKKLLIDESLQPRRIIKALV